MDPTASDLRVGFIGLGDMGAPMAHNIIAAGFATTLWARRAASLEPFDATRCRRAESLQELGRHSDVVGVCVVNEDDVREVLLGDSGVISGMRRSGIVLIHSTVSLATCQEVAEAAAPKGIDVLDAPVSGLKDDRAAGRLTVMVGGDQDCMSRAMPVLRAVGEVIRWLGPLGSGQRMKALNNVTCFSNGYIANVAIETGRAMGFDPRTVIDILSASSGASATLRAISIKLAAPDAALAEHTSRLVEKDTQVFREFRKAAGLSPSPLEAIGEQWAHNLLPALDPQDARRG